MGVDDTTEEIEIVHKDETEKIVYFDSPGLNQTINVTHAEYLKAFYSIDIMFVATSTTFKNSIRAIQVMDKINPPKLLLVRNQCDKFESDQAMQKCKEKDKKFLTQHSITRQVLYVSTLRDDSFMDNAQFNKLMKGK